VKGDVHDIGKNIGRGAGLQQLRHRGPGRCGALSDSNEAQKQGADMMSSEADYAFAG
jgi:methanogenic corrinoid protein MtbC1